MEMVDSTDSKSDEAEACVGSNPTTPTKFFESKTYKIAIKDVYHRWPHPDQGTQRYAFLEGARWLWERTGLKEKS